jgi:acetylornithine aminotransferase
MSNQTWVDMTAKYVANTYGRYPVAMVRGEGCYLWDADGKRYLDMVAGLAVCNLGHAHPAVAEAIREQAGKLLHVSNLYHIPQQSELARKIVDKSFGDRVFFCNSGAEANEAALKLARKFGHDFGGGRHEIITTHGSFHGRTYGAVSATGQEKYQAGFYPLLPGIKHVTYGDLAALEAAFTAQTAAVLLEPIQGEGGVNMPPPGYFKAVRELCDRHGVLLILDEVQVGNARTGKLWAYEHEDIRPDMMSLAKGLAGGVPVGALVMTESVSRSFVPGTHASTFGGNPLAMAAGLAAFEALSQPAFLAHVEKMGAYLTGKLHAMAARVPVITQVRGRGLIVGAELSVPGGDAVKRCMERGVLLNCARDRVIRFIPPLVVTERQLDEALDVLEAALAPEVSRG